MPLSFFPLLGYLGFHRFVNSKVSSRDCIIYFKMFITCFTENIFLPPYFLLLPHHPLLYSQCSWFVLFHSLSSLYLPFLPCFPSFLVSSLLPSLYPSPSLSPSFAPCILPSFFPSLLPSLLLPFPPSTTFNFYILSSFVKWNVLHLIQICSSNKRSNSSIFPRIPTSLPQSTLVSFP